MAVRNCLHVCLCMCSGSDDEVDDKPIETTGETELYKLTLPTDVTAAPQVEKRTHILPVCASSSRVADPDSAACVAVLWVDLLFSNCTMRLPSG